MSKIFELCLSRIMDTYLFTSDNQFGFKRNHSTDLCIYTVKSIIRYYNYYNRPVQGRKSTFKHGGDNIGVKYTPLMWDVSRGAKRLT